MVYLLGCTYTHRLKGLLMKRSGAADADDRVDDPVRYALRRDLCATVRILEWLRKISGKQPGYVCV